MTEKVVPLQDVGSHRPEAPWVLILGGVSREGNRRARRAARQALEGGLAVVWFDGFAETHDDPSGSRVPLDVERPSADMLVVDYKEAERRHWLNRMVEGVPEALESPLAVLEGGLRRRGTGGLVRLALRLRLLVGRVGSLLRRKLLKRIGLVFRSRLNWSLVSDYLVEMLRRSPGPEQVVYGDDFALTQAWRVARLLPDVRVSMELEPR